MLAGCVSSLEAQREAVCRDGFQWTREGASRLYMPTDEGELRRIEAAVQGRGRLLCMHNIPDGTILVVTLQRRTLVATDLRLIDGVYSVVDEGIFVGH